MKAKKKKLYIAMANACMSTKETAEAAGLPYQSFVNVIRGASVRPATIGKVARALGVPVEQILEDE